MKVTMIAVSVLAASVFSTSVLAADGNVRFNGTITDVACTVDTNSLDQTVQMGTISSKAFPDVGSTAAATKFSLVLNQCPATVTTATVSFDGQQVVGDASILAIEEGQDAATNVGIQIQDNQNKVINLYTPSSPYTLLPEVDNTLNFVARYIATAVPVTTGAANSAAQFTIIYQ
jgi:major type 1 subunit fimbrin (pilin)